MAMVVCRCYTHQVGHYMGGKLIDLEKHPLAGPDSVEYILLPGAVGKTVAEVEGAQGSQAVVDSCWRAGP